jgi:SAM-dependent methyltransferase
VSTRWTASGGSRGDDYDARWTQMAAAGESVHGEADLVEAWLRAGGGTRVLDAGCGTGRVAIELAARGFAVVGVDADPTMLGAARAKAPSLPWVEADLATLDAAPGAADGPFDLVVLAGNVMIFVDPGTEGAVLAGLAARLVPGGILVAGFQLGPGRLALAEYDRFAAGVGLDPVDRFATWAGDPYDGGDYAVSVHRAPGR